MKFSFFWMGGTLVLVGMFVLWMVPWSDGKLPTKQPVVESSISFDDAPEPMDLDKSFYELKAISLVGGVDQVLENFDQRLVRIFRKEASTTEMAYEMTEGELFGMSSGKYVLGRAKNGDVILLVSIKVGDTDGPRVLNEIVHVPRWQWQKEQRKAQRSGMQFPSMRIFHPKDRIEVAGQLVGYGGWF